MSDYPDLTPVEPGGEWRLAPRPQPEHRPPVDTSKWPCELCGHGHYPGERCGANGCECRA